MAVINKTIAASSLPITFNRGNPVPLDKSAVWYSLDELKEALNRIEKFLKENNLI